MWRALAVRAVMFGLYWADQTFYSGTYDRKADIMLQHIMSSFR